MQMEKGVQRWVVDISEWNPTPHDFSFALSVLPQHEQSPITRFVRMEDRKRALVSRLLQYALVRQVLGIPYQEIIIKRTIEGKPYLECDRVSMDFPNFNFSVSHHGDYVAIASEPLCLVGLDVVSYMIPCKEPVVEFVQNFSSYFSSFEWDNILNAGTCDEILIEFYRYWCLKEAYVKAIGIGVANSLDKVEFHHTGWANISVKSDGVTATDWRFWLFELGKGHWVAVAKGPPRSATESYKRTLTRSDFDEEDYNNGLNLPNAPFLYYSVEQLIAFLCKGNGKGKLEANQNA
ncbi:L-aminoadipate-semialdehyde dehydrogenase-phosphopantetheinyl transferase-like [Melia azedarach]|uniref:L-aminoadipate-semialdehyde dehydrogenase-phosphopantetheinyl transferase-like n=1 Tax=Melia azedarach TaxID=155640 RepID=A0ACC1YAY3_MELAZ|nr:L-aminoadipate-semialdehyde dehydrogenase-phosphopantetheinyl transferase-like [Melia azedarach]